MYRDNIITVTYFYTLLKDLNFKCLIGAFKINPSRRDIIPREDLSYISHKKAPLKTT